MVIAGDQGCISDVLGVYATKEEAEAELKKPRVKEFEKNGYGVAVHQMEIADWPSGSQAAGAGGGEGKGKKKATKD